MKTLIKISIAVFYLITLGSCTSSIKFKNIELAKNIELNKFMGKWYVIAAIPTYIEKNAFNSTETYELNPDGTINTIFNFNKGSLTGPKKTYNPTGFIVENSGNAKWGMRFIWPFKAEYLIAYLDKDYSQTIIARNKRDYVWIMARSSKMNNLEYDRLVSKVKSLGYDTTKLIKVPHN
jgi:apolipoprotein D and lipocalin family protein